MKKLLILFLLVTGSLSAQSVFNDTIFFNRFLPRLEQQIGTFNAGQEVTLRNAVLPIIRQSAASKLTPEQRKQMRRDIRAAVLSQLTPTQRQKLKANRREKQDGLDRAIGRGIE